MDKAGKKGGIKMKPRKTILFLTQFLLVVLLWVNAAFANKASVSIEAPAEVTKGSEITIRLCVKLTASYPGTLPDAWNNLGVLATREGRISDSEYACQCRGRCPRKEDQNG